MFPPDERQALFGPVKGGLAGRAQRAEKVLGGSPANLARVVAASDPSTIVEHIVWLRDASGAFPPLGWVSPPAGHPHGHIWEHESPGVSL